MPAASAVRLTIHDVLGRTVATIADGQFAPGTHETKWSAESLAKEIYIVRLEPGPFLDTQMMILR